VYAQNVYEWEQPGAGSCAASQTAGCIFLISDGKDVTPNNGGDPLCPESSVCLLGSDVSGKNVFFTTADQLVPADTNTEVDIYDARVCEPEQGNPCVTEPPPPLPPCNEEACHGTPAGTPSLLTPGTATFNGAGNLVPAVSSSTPRALTRAQELVNALKGCRKDRKKSKRVACEKQARAKYGPVKHKKAKKSAHTNRRTHS
jgi:hypothetical protein